MTPTDWLGRRHGRGWDVVGSVYFLCVALSLGSSSLAVDHCGAHPHVPNGDVVQQEQMSLKYQCNAFYKLDGLDTVVCYSDGSWSPLPICKEAFCVLDPNTYVWADFQLSGVQHVKEGEPKFFPCIWPHFSRLFRCTEGRIHYTPCCHYSDIQRGLCQ